MKKRIVIGYVALILEITLLGITQSACIAKPATAQEPVSLVRLPIDLVVPKVLPIAIHDEILMEAWVRLYNHQETIQLWEGKAVSGSDLAQFVLDQSIPIVWDTKGICGPGSCSVQHCFEDVCTFEDGKPGIDLILIHTSLQKHSQELPGTLAHEIFHRTQPFGAVEDSLYEEYWALCLENQINGASWPSFTGVDPQDREKLILWFAANEYEYYFRLPVYPPGVQHK